MDFQHSHSDEAAGREAPGRHSDDKPYMTPELRELGSLKETTLGEVSGNMEDSLMKKKTVA
jgi:hypothetical protein